MAKNTTITVADNMSNVFKTLSSLGVTGLQYTNGSSRIDYSDKKQRSATLKFEVDRWTSKDKERYGDFDGYGVYIGRDNAFASVGEALSIGENKRTNGGSYERKKQFYVWIRTKADLDTLYTLIGAVATGKGTTLENVTEKPSKKANSKRKQNAKKAVNA